MSDIPSSTPSPVEPPNAEVLDRFFAAEASAAEEAQVYGWGGRSPSGEFLADIVRAVIRTVPAGVTDPRMMRDALRARLGISSPAQKPAKIVEIEDHGPQPWVSQTGRSAQLAPKGVFPLSRRAWTVLLSVASAVLIAVMVHMLLPTGIQFSRSIPAVTTYVTTAGERANITLPDGSRVTLDVASQLQVPMDFMHGDRQLRLNGEAIFTVAHHDGAPLTVTAGTATARVLGTTFLVRHYAGDTTTLVVVREGKVGVRSAVLTAREMIAVGPGGAAPIHLADESEFSFADGVLTLPYMTLGDAIPELDRWYDADIRVNDPALARQKVGGRFVAGSRVDLVTVLEASFDVRVVRDGRVLTLYPK